MGLATCALMSRLGQYLRTRGLVTGEQLEEALGHQAVQGARLGTNLIELGVLSIEQLAQCLSEFHQVPLPPREWLEKPQRAAVQRVTRPLVERLRFVPLRLEGKVLHAALLDPRHPNALDDLRFATGCRIEPYVLPEIWMHDWLLALFKIPRGIRQVAERAPDAPGAAQQKSGPDFNAHMPDAPPQFETTAMTNAQTAAAAAAADARRIARSAPRVESRQATAPRRVQTAPAAQPAPTAQPARTSQPQPLRATPAAAAAPASLRAPPPPPPPRAQPSTPAPPPPPRPPAASVRPPSMRVRAHAPLSAIEGESWALPAQQASSEPPRPSAPPSLRAPALPEPGPLPEAAAQAEASAEPTAPVLEPLTMARELAHWESALAQAADRERLIEVAFSIAACFAARVGLFTVHQGMIQGLRQLERGLPRPIEGVLVPLDAPSMLAEAATRAEPLRVDPTQREADLRVRELLQDEHATEVALFPIAIKHRVVNVLYASNAHEPLGPIAFGALALVAQAMGLAYGRLILIRKAGTGA